MRPIIYRLYVLLSYTPLLSNKCIEKNTDQVEEETKMTRNGYNDNEDNVLSPSERACKMSSDRVWSPHPLASP